MDPTSAGPSDLGAPRSGGPFAPGERPNSAEQRWARVFPVALVAASQRILRVRHPARLLRKVGSYGQTPLGFFSCLFFQQRPQAVFAAGELSLDKPTLMSSLSPRLSVLHDLNRRILPLAVPALPFSPKL